MEDNNENINYILEDNIDRNELNIINLMNMFEYKYNTKTLCQSPMVIDEYNNYDKEDLNKINIKQLLLICEYYNIKINKLKLKKEQIICIINNYENNYMNYLNVKKRKILWKYIDILKNDNFMKKFIIW